MAARKHRKGMPFHPDEVRAKIKASMLVHRLHEHIEGRVELSMTQVRAIDILLRKCIPDLTRTEVTADVNHTYVIELPPMLSREEWLKKYAKEQPFDLPTIERIN